MCEAGIEKVGGKALVMGFTSYSFLSKSSVASILGLLPLREPVEALVLTAALHQQSLLHQA